MRSTMKSFMKIKQRQVWAIVCLVCAVVSVAAAMEDAAVKDYAGYPKPDEGYVTDIANLLTDAQEAQLEGWLYDCEKEKGVEVAVVTIGSISDYPGTANSSVEAFATGLFGTYGIGNMPKNDGVLLLVAVKDREARIELGDGYTSSREMDSGRIMQNVIVPQFRNGRFDRGILNGIQSILLTFAGKDVTGGSQAVPVPPVPQDTATAQKARTTPPAAPIPDVSSHQTSPRGYTPAPVRYTQPGRNSFGHGGAGLMTILLFLGIPVIGIVVLVSLLSNRTGGSSGYAGGSMGLQNNSIIGQNGSGIVPDDGYNRGFWNGLFMGGMGRQGLHNGGIMFGGRSSHNHGTGFGGMSSHHTGMGFGSRSIGGFGGGFGGGHSGGSHSSFGGGFSHGGGATGKW